MKVLHVSDNPLPDIRAEKMAYVSKKRGWEIFFAGPPSNEFALGEKIFDGIYDVPWNRYVRLGLPPYFQSVTRKMKRIVESIRPDVIHAHDVFSGKVLLDLGYPLVFDDHELVSMEKKSDVDFGDLSDRTAGRYETWLWSRWEDDLSKRAPVITVSDGIAEFYTKLGAKVFAVPNYPSLYELSKVNPSSQKSHPFAAVYLGNDVAFAHKPYRNVRGMTDVFKELDLRLVVIGDRKLTSQGPILSEGYVQHLKLYEIMSRFHVGLLPWDKHWFHRYSNPNKPYMYAHSGMVVVVTSSLENVVNAFKGRARTIDDLSDLKKVMLELSHDIESAVKEGEDNKAYALNNLVFEQHEDKVIEAYKQAT